MREFIFVLLLVYISLSGCETKNETPFSLIPQVSSVDYSGEYMNLDELEVLVLPEEWIELGGQINSFQKQYEANILQVADKIESKGIRFQQSAELGNEEYILSINDRGILIKASDYAGAFNALQTYKQIVSQSEKGSIQYLQIKDKPRFEYRGLMLDCSRHFWTVDELKESIDQMSLFKLNKLHLHLTDNNAWRIEIKAFPKLTSVGTYYEDYPELSDKFYTQDDLKEIVRYASKRNIEVIPEIDLPGHAIALLAAYPEYSCEGGKFEPYPEEMPPSKRYKNTANMICVGNKAVYDFVGTIVEEMASIFPSKKIHLGGDEVPTKVWETCDKCKDLHHQHNMEGWHNIQDYFTKKMSEIAANNNRIMIGWDEINDHQAASSEDIIMIWRDYGFERAIEALERDVPVIMAPQHGCYFDWGYAGNSTRKVYEWDPISTEITMLNKNHLVIGGQACLWTERVSTQDRVEEMLYPRLIALAEVLWTSKKQRDWESFLIRLENNYGLLTNQGISYFIDDAINELEFVPKKEKPSLVRHAMLSTSIPNHGNYHLEYIFDGRSNTFYWGGRSMRKGDWYEIELGECVKANTVKVITGDSKDYIQYGDLLISFDGEKFEHHASFDELGVAKANVKGKLIKKIRIQVSKDVASWPVIKEVKID
ncbi:beta-N-acetylhexosaminidase [Carboxylicivirga sp. N1Y90]|uniref:beta-N-acetylhexosaminidase n=1 Tax=Carboxylicivirga fragile TaxID=3417571 RepID=UPI003D34B177|nr:beta-N-acetylhexosaminidase [Marinilabiliaceae bacterium N1Y90]